MTAGFADFHNRTGFSGNFLRRSGLKKMDLVQISQKAHRFAKTVLSILKSVITNRVFGDGFPYSKGHPFVVGV